jgi:hypothetical protein
LICLQNGNGSSFNRGKNILRPMWNTACSQIKIWNWIANQKIHTKIIRYHHKQFIYHPKMSVHFMSRKHKKNRRMNIGWI